jgi:hypothetical protein
MLKGANKNYLGVRGLASPQKSQKPVHRVETVEWSSVKGGVRWGAVATTTTI